MPTDSRTRLSRRIRRLCIDFIAEGHENGTDRQSVYRDLGATFLVFSADTLAASENLKGKKRKAAAQDIIRVAQKQLIRHRPKD